MKTRANNRISRRRLLDAAAMGFAGLGLGKLALAEAAPAEEGAVRDRFWIFTCAANSDFPHIGRRSVMTPVEGAFYLGVPNIIVVQSSESEAPHARRSPTSPASCWTTSSPVGRTGSGRN